MVRSRAADVSTADLRIVSEREAVARERAAFRLGVTHARNYPEDDVERAAVFQFPDPVSVILPDETERGTPSGEGK